MLSDPSSSEWSKEKSAPLFGGAVGGDRGGPVLLDRGLLELGIALEPERLGEADDGRGRGARAARELLRGEEGRLVEMVDDVAGDVFLGPGELVEALLDVLGEAGQLGGFGGCLGHGGPFRRDAGFPFRSGWMQAADDVRAGAPHHQPQHGRLRSRPRVGGDRGTRGDAPGPRPRRALPRRGPPLPPLRPDLAHLRRRPHRRRPPRRGARLVGAGLAARDRDRDRRRSGPPRRR